MIIDITPYVMSENMSEDPELKEFSLCVPKKIYDEAGGALYLKEIYFKIKNSHYELETFDTNYFGLGLDYDIHIQVLLKELHWSKRQNKIESLGL